jgi:hypothetical protein
MQDKIYKKIEMQISISMYKEALKRKKGKRIKGQEKKWRKKRQTE